MTIAAHAVLGAGIHGIVAHFIGCDPTTFVVSGGIFGALPDILGWVGRITGNGWETYNEAHRIEKSNPLVYMPASALHLAVDALTHRGGGKWWPKFWWAEVLTWVVGLALLAITYDLTIPL